MILSNSSLIQTCSMIIINYYYYRLDVPILIIKKQHIVKRNSSSRMNSLKMIRFMTPTRIYFLNKNTN